jgi:hypothetical protein
MHVGRRQQLPFTDLQPTLARVDLRIVKAEIDGSDGIILTFSDETVGAYIVGELLDLRPHREPTIKLPQPAKFCSWIRFRATDG